jgi:peptidoglycan biosynthesis protein MviN/MurJ (putative lipid II flippase)
VLLWLARTKLGGLDGRRLSAALAKIAVASLFMAFAAYHVERLLHVPFGGAAVFTQMIRVFGAIAAALTVLAAAAHVLRIDEFAQLRRRAFTS